MSFGHATKRRVATCTYLRRAREVVSFAVLRALLSAVVRREQLKREGRREQLEVRKELVVLAELKAALLREVVRVNFRFINTVKWIISS